MVQVWPSTEQLVADGGGRGRREKGWLAWARTKVVLNISHHIVVLVDQTEENKYTVSLILVN